MMVTSMVDLSIDLAALGHNYRQLRAWCDPQVKVLAVVTNKRAEFAPNVPTVVELGYPLVYIPLLGLTGPKGLPGEIAEKLDNLVAKICTEPEFQTKMRNIPLQVMYGNSAAYEKTSMKFKDDILAHFKEEGLVK